MTDSVVIAWEMDRIARGTVAYGTTGALSQRQEAVDVGRRQVIKLEGLVPYQVYQYRVEHDGAPLCDTNTFRSAASPSETSFSFVVLGDTRTQHDIHQAVVGQARALAPDFVLHTGDLVGYGRRRHEWETFFRIEQPLIAEAPLYPILGNHEEYALHYFNLFILPDEERWYTFEYGNARFIGLQVDGYAAVDRWSEQYRWLEETLAANRHPWLIAFFHIPPYSALSKDPEGLLARQYLIPLLEEHGVDIVLNGHHHNYQRIVVHGVTYLITGGGGAPIYEIRNPEAHNDLLAYRGDHHVVQITIEDDRLTGRAIDLDGEPFDRFTLSNEARGDQSKSQPLARPRAVA
jgi:predicted phosphodiesterase